MAGRIPQSFIDELIGRTDIVELVSSRVPLKKAGREYRACCPFHDEKTPSFWVSPDKQFYHCFGCGAHGTAIGFLMAYDRLAFPEAIEELASHLGLLVPHEQSGAIHGAADASREQADDEARLHRLLEQAAGHYRRALAASPRAQAYAARRGLSPETLERFAIGYAPDAWNTLLERFGASAAMLRDLAAAGLIARRDLDASSGPGGAQEGAEGAAPGSDRGASAAGSRSGYYDRFRDRLMFPIRDSRGRVIGFGGRLLGAGEPKYLNSPETALFHKGRELYALYESRQARRRLERLLIVEGYLDAVTLHQAGLTYAVAALGTATTADHVRRAFRTASELVFAFDGDRAGRAAAWRALQAVLPEAREGREIRFLFLPEGEDPDSLVGREGGAAFEARLSAALPLSEYLVAQLLSQTEVGHADGKAHFVALARPLLERLPSGVYRDLVLERMAQALGVGAERLQHWLIAPPDRRAPPAPTSAPATLAPRARGTGRGGLVTQAITLLLHFPAAADAVGTQARAALAQIRELPGVAVLSELLEQQTGGTPGAAGRASSAAQIVERWRERHEYRRLLELAGSEMLVADAEAAARELSEAVARLLDEHLRRARLESLIATARDRGLDESEKQELQALTRGPSASTPGAARDAGPLAPETLTGTGEAEAIQIKSDATRPRAN